MTDALKGNRLFSFIVILLIYMAAAALGTVTFLMLSSLKIIIRLCFSDLLATLLIWIAGVLLKNASVYDPYWSVAPVAMIPLTVLYQHACNIGTGLLVVVILFWGVRLTVNWAVTFKHLNAQDWRYTKLKKEHAKLWPAVNLLGIHIFPTAVVMMVMLPAFDFITYFTALNVGAVLSALLCIFAVTLQIVSDTQLHQFKKIPANHGRIINTGIWKTVRHPNYLGEILMWWGISFMQISVDPAHWFLCIGAIINTVMFVTISIPLMENRQLQNKPAYSEYQSKTGMLLPKLF